MGAIISIEFDQTNFENVAIEDQIITFMMRFSIPDEANSRWSVFFPLGWKTSNMTSDGEIAIIYSPTKTINQFDYPEISETLYADQLVWPTNDTFSEIQIKRVAMSFGFGLVEYELLDGTVYSLLR